MPYVQVVDIQYQGYVAYRLPVDRATDADLRCSPSARRVSLNGGRNDIGYREEAYGHTE